MQLCHYAGLMGFIIVRFNNFRKWECVDHEIPEIQTGFGWMLIFVCTDTVYIKYEHFLVSPKLYTTHHQDHAIFWWLILTSIMAFLQPPKERFPWRKDHKLQLCHWLILLYNITTILMMSNRKTNIYIYIYFYICITYISPLMRINKFWF